MDVLTSSNKRIIWIDLVKAFGIFLVILGHSIQYLHHSDQFWSNSVWEFIYSFHMPLFFMISGCVFTANQTFRKFIINKTRGLLLPFIVWNLIAFIFKRKIQFDDLWFLIVLYIDVILLFVLKKLYEKNKILVYCIVLMLYLLPNVDFLPYFGICKYYLIFLFLGTFVFHLLENKNISFYMFVICLILFIIFSPLYEGFFQGIFNTFYVLKPFSFDEKVFITIYKLIIGFSGCYIIIYTFSKFDIPKESILIQIGQSTCAIYLLQFFILERLIPIFLNLNFINLDGRYGIIIYTCISTIISLICLFLCYYSSLFLKKNKIIGFILFGAK